MYTLTYACTASQAHIVKRHLQNLLCAYVYHQIEVPIAVCHAIVLSVLFR